MTEPGEHANAGNGETQPRTLADLNEQGPWADQWAATDAAMHIIDALERDGATDAAPLMTPRHVVVGEDGTVAVIPVPGGSPDSRYQTSESWSTGRAARTDAVYSIGALLFEMLTGSPPSSVGDDATVAALRLRGDIDPRLAQVVARALATNPAVRYASLPELRSALAGLQVAVSTPTELRRTSLADAAAPLGPPAPPLPVRRTPWTLIITVASLIVAAGLGLLLLRDSGGGTTTVPTVAGLGYPDAERQLVGADLRPVRIDEPSVAVAAGNVIRTNPAAGEQVDAGAQVIVVVSGQAVAGTVPAVVGLPQAQASSILSQFGLTATFAQEADPAAAGTVIRQVPAAGTPPQPVSSVALTVSTGPAPGQATTPAPSTSGTVAVPSLTGQSVPAASSLLQQAGLGLGPVTYQSSVQTPGTVISQQPAAGAIVASGTIVSLLASQ